MKLVKTVKTHQVTEKINMLYLESRMKVRKKKLTNSENLKHVNSRNQKPSKITRLTLKRIDFNKLAQ